MEPAEGIEPGGLHRRHHEGLRDGEPHPPPYFKGNGRSTQTLLSQLARDSRYQLRFANIEKRCWDMAAARSRPQVNARQPLLTWPAYAKPIHAAFKAIVVPLERMRQADPER